MEKMITRRDLLKKSAALAIGGSILLNSPLDSLAWGTQKKSVKSRVVLIRNEKLFANGNQPDPTIAAQMLDEALCKLTGKNDVKKAWASIVKPTDIVGIKTNGWDKFPTPEIVNTLLKERVLQAGVKAENVSVKDRGVTDDPVFQNSTALINVRPMRTHAWAGVGTCIKNFI
ncbi:MAG: twin-arginine translocation signal domain-containing protein, partial [Candidatus Azobacteroides sp.]|nr:twin-arginine translocation signal domain-containing protein [Candidatus Azobacteroides sp.]